MKITFIGGGNMATALIGGLLKQGFSANDLRVVEVSADSCQRLRDTFNIQANTDLAAGINGQDVIVLAVKPQQLHDLTKNLAPLVNGQLLISIAAGIRASDLARWLNTTQLVRAMPNTPALIQQGVTGLYALPAVTPIQRELASAILGAVGSTIWLTEETQLDAVTAISGSGPAYVFYFMEAMQQAAKELGLDSAQAKRLVIDTFLGASALANISEETVGELRARVTSKNGTTERALLSMENAQVKQHISTAVHAAATRSQEMGNEFGSAA
jgi:pyrroline-5-carboxylate reductase